jgi:hypothetical protein
MANALKAVMEDAERVDIKEVVVVVAVVVVVVVMVVVVVNRTVHLLCLSERITSRLKL